MSCTPSTPQYSQEYLKHLLPLAWSHNPLTTLKLICNLLGTNATSSGEEGKLDAQCFYTAAYWLFQHHPKTLACNAPLIADSFGYPSDLLEILYRALRRSEDCVRMSPTLQGKDEQTEKGIGGRTDTVMANNALERYHLDRDYRLLHDTVSNLYASCLKFDIQNLNNCVNEEEEEEEEDVNKSKPKSSLLKMTSVRPYCPDVNSKYDHATLLCESIAKKMFPRKSEEEEADYAYIVRTKLRKEVLAPLKKFSDSCDRKFKREPCAVRTYLEEVKASGGIKAGALLPTEIIGFVVENNNDDDVGLVAAAELQWKTMVEDIYLKQGKFKNCLAVCDVDSFMYPLHMETSVSFGILLSQLSEEPWNGKLMTFPNPKLVSIRGHDLKSTYKLMSTMEEEYDDYWVLELDFHKVFDLILQVAVDGKLKPEQMIKKVFVFSFCGRNDRWESSDYEEVHNKFKDKGYGDVVPQVVFWNLCLPSNYYAVEAPRTQSGINTFSGFQTKNFFKSFLENDGDIGPDQFMEAAISGEKYENLVVVD